MSGKYREVELTGNGVGQTQSKYLSNKQAECVDASLLYGSSIQNDSVLKSKSMASRNDSVGVVAKPLSRRPSNRGQEIRTPFLQSV
jgi:hypothetical protein